MVGAYGGYDPGPTSADIASSMAQDAQRGNRDLAERVARLERRVGIAEDGDLRAKLRTLCNERSSGGIHTIRVEELRRILAED